MDDADDEQYEELLANLENDPTTINDLPDQLFLQVSLAGLPKSVTEDINCRQQTGSSQRCRIAGNTQLTQCR